MRINPTCNLANMSTPSFQQSGKSLQHTYLSLLRPVRMSTSVTSGKRLDWLHIVGEVIYPSLLKSNHVMYLYVNYMNKIVFLIYTVLS